MIGLVVAAAAVFGFVLDLNPCDAAHGSPPALITDPQLATIALETLDQAQFFGHLHVNQQRFRVLFDTGSNSIWVPNNLCDPCAGTERLKATESTGTQRFQRLYGSGRVVGHVEQATLALDNGVILGNVSIGSVDEQDGDIRRLDCEGVVGLAFPSHDEPDHQTNLLASLSNLKHFEGQSLAFTFAFHPPEASTPSHLLLGSVDRLLLQDSHSSTFFFPLAMSSAWGRHGFWSLALNVITVDDQPIMARPVAALIDSGSSLLLLPRSSFELAIQQLEKALGSRVHRSGRDFVICHRCSHADFPMLSFTLAGSIPRTFAMHGRDYVRCEHGACEPQLGAIDNEQDSEPVAVLGLLFLRAYPTVFDYTERRVVISCCGKCLDGGPTQPLAPVRRRAQGQSSMLHFLTLVLMLLVMTGSALYLRANWMVS